MIKRMMSSSKNISVKAALNQSEITWPTGENAIWYTTAVLMVIVIILATVGNLMVLAAMWIERNLRQPNRYFIGCLAVADLWIGVFFCPLQLYSHISEVGLTSIHLCRFYIWINILGESASIYTLTWISYDRFLKISKPLRYNVIMTTKKSIIVIIMIWIISTACATFGMFPYLGSPGIAITPKGCTNRNPLFYTVSAFTAFFVPTVIMLVMYTRILFIANKRRKRAQNGELGQTSQVTNHHTSLYQDLKNIRMMAIVVGAFVLCWGPFFIIMLIFNRFFNEILRSLAASILPPLNSVCNPIIYACFDGKYREAFKRLFKRMCR